MKKKILKNLAALSLCSLIAISACSVWKNSGVEAYASKFIGNGKAQCFCNCR